jgi:hypothetical protein
MLGYGHLFFGQSRKIGISQNHFCTSKIKSLNIVVSLTSAALVHSSFLKASGSTQSCKGQRQKLKAKFIPRRKEKFALQIL